MTYVQILSRVQPHAAPVALAAAMLLAAPAAFGQMAGTYTGTNNEGDQVQVVVASTGSGFEITAVSDGGTVYCTKAGTTYGYGVSFGGAAAVITKHRASFDDLAINVYIDSSYTFKGTTVSGAIVFGVPILQSPKKAAACSTKPQTFTATLGGAAAAAPFHGALAWPVAK